MFSKINKKGFTLTELMVVVLIVAILAAIALPLYNNSVDNQNNARAKAILEVINGGMERFNREYPGVIIPTPGAGGNTVYISNPAVHATCTYVGQNNLSMADFINQMIACGYIPRYNYGSAVFNPSPNVRDTSIDYRFALQKPTNPVYGRGYVYMEPKTNAKVGSKFCRQGETGCTYKAGIGRNGKAIDIYNPN